MRLPNGFYRTAAGSTVILSGTNGGKTYVVFDWMEEDACSDCRANPYPDENRLTWDCDVCGGGSAELSLDAANDDRGDV